MIGLALAVATDVDRSLAAELAATAPIWILAVAALLLLVADAFARTRAAGFLRGPALLAIGLAAWASWRALGDPTLDLGRFLFDGYLLVDHLTSACDLVLLAALAREHGGPAAVLPSFGEREVLLLLAGVGGLACVHAGDLLTMWLGVELLTIAALLLMLASHDAATGASKRAALLGALLPQAVASALLLLGVALVFAALGSTSLDGFGGDATAAFARWGGVQRWVGLFEHYGAEVAERDPGMIAQGRGEIVRGLAPVALLMPGLLLLLAGVLAKLGMLPFARRRELAEAAPLHVTALWTTVAAVALVAVLLRVFVGALHSPRLVNEPYGWTGALPTIALLTGGWASLAVLRQRRLSRVLALLSATQLSILLLGLTATANFHGHIGADGRQVAPEYEILWTRLTGDEAYAAVLVSLIATVLATVGAFAAVAASRGFRGPEVRMQHWSGMAARRPALALAFSICLASLVGLPPLVGFVAKVGLLRALAEHSAMRWMIAPVVLELALGGIVVLRIIAAMYFGDETVSEPGRRRSPGPAPAATAMIAAAACLALGLGGQRLLVFARLPAAGGSFEPGDDDRLEWLEQRREVWAEEDARALAEPEPAPEGLNPASVEPGGMSVEPSSAAPDPDEDAAAAD